MSLYDINEYFQDIMRVANTRLPWERLQDKSVVLTGATGLLGSFLVDVLMQKKH